MINTSRRASLAGPNRETNQDLVDSIFKNESFKVFMLFDGMGGHLGGEHAAATGAGIMKEFILNNDSLSPEDIVKKAVSAANSTIYKEGHDPSMPDLYNMGTTIAAFVEYENRFFFINVGDSSGYLLRDEKLQKITKDDSLVQVLFDSGVITREQMKTHPRKNEITKALGITAELEPNISEYGEIISGDMFILCSDGVTDLLSDEELEFILSLNTLSLDDKITRIMTIVKERGFHDNSSIYLIEYHE